MLIAAERHGDTVEQLIEKIVYPNGDQEAPLSAIGLTELIHVKARATLQSDDVRGLQALTSAAGRR